jgi:hypothetical protein
LVSFSFSFSFFIIGIIIFIYFTFCFCHNLVRVDVNFVGSIPAKGYSVATERAILRWRGLQLDRFVDCHCRRQSY